MGPSTSDPVREGFGRPGQRTRVFPANRRVAEAAAGALVGEPERLSPCFAMTASPVVAHEGTVRQGRSAARPAQLGEDEGSYVGEDLETSSARRKGTSKPRGDDGGLQPDPGRPLAGGGEDGESGEGAVLSVAGGHLRC